MVKDIKNERFQRVALARTRKIIATIDQLGNCADRRCYCYTAQEVEQIFATIHQALAKTHRRFDQEQR